MTGTKISLAILLLAAVFGCVLGQQLTHEERCQVIEGNGVRVDQCDGTKLLACKDGRCQCADPANQVYTYRNEVIAPSRAKRSPGKKGSGFKKVAAGAVAGVATYHVAKTVSKGFSTTPPPPKYRRAYSCYSRVGGQCALNYNNWESIDSSSTTTAKPTDSTTSAAPAANATESDTSVAADNSTSTTTTSTTPAPVAAAQTGKLDISKIPKCVQNAICKLSSPGANGTSSFHQKVDFDPRIGMCECEDGYERTSKDLCLKVNKSAGENVGASVTVILATLLFNKMFVF